MATLPIFVGQATWSKQNIVCCSHKAENCWKCQNINSVFIGQNEVHSNQKVAAASSHVEYALTRGQILIICIQDT